MAESKSPSQQASGERQSGRTQQQSSSDRPRGRQSLQRRETGLSPFGGGPFQIVRRMSEEMDRVFEQMLGGASLGARGGTSEAIWAPRVEAFQKEDQFIVRAELPGLNRNDIQVEVTGDSLVIQGERRDEREEQREGAYLSERFYGQFHRRIPLPDDVIPESAEAEFRDGVLKITMQAPPAEVGQARRVEIKEAAGTQSKQQDKQEKR
jgi:HSP20 family protein